MSARFLFIQLSVLFVFFAKTQFIPFAFFKANVGDVTLDPINWADFIGTSSSNSIFDIDTNITLEISAVNGTGAPTLEYRKNGGSWTVFTTIVPASVGVIDGDTLEFQVSGTASDTATITIINASDTNALVDIVTGTVPSSDPCLATIAPSLGTVCDGGAVYAGVFEGARYMISDSDNTGKSWRGSAASFNLDIFDIMNVGTGLDSTPSLSEERGHVTSPKMDASFSVSPNSAVLGCLNSTFSGHTDWYLPSKSELAYLYCHAGVASHNSSYPEEDPNCAAYGGKTSDLPNFTSAAYLSSTEVDAANAWSQNFTDGNQVEIAKSTNARTRCVRRYFPSGSDVTLDSLTWSDFYGTSSVEAFTGIDTAINIEISASHISGSPTYEYSKNSGPYVAFSPGAPAAVSFSNGDTLAFQVSGTIGHSGTIQVTNVSDTNSNLGKIIATIPNACEAVGGRVVNGQCWFLGNSGSSCTVTCAGKAGFTNTHQDTIDWAGSGGSNANCETVLNAFPSTGPNAVASFPEDFGCNVVNAGLTRRRGSDPTTQSATLGGRRRACACQP